MTNVSLIFYFDIGIEFKGRGSEGKGGEGRGIWAVGGIYTNR